MDTFDHDQYQTYINTYRYDTGMQHDTAHTVDPWEGYDHTVNLPKRHPECSQIKFYYDHQYRGWEVMHWPGYRAQIENYLERTWDVIEAALSEYPRLYAVRVDLHYPAGYPVERSRDNQCLKRFFYYLQWELDQSNFVHKTRVHYVWAREQVSSLYPHYHLVLMFNKDTLYGIGKYSPSDQGGYHHQSLFHRIVRAWAYALELENDSRMKGLVHYAVEKHYEQLSPDEYDVPRCPQVVDYDSGQFEVYRGKHDSEMARLYYRASYLCKAYSKRFGEGAHCFGSSRRRRR
jgi:hypothetical protein